MSYDDDNDEGLNESELEFQARARLHLGKRADCVFWRNAVGVAKTHGGHAVRYGLCRGSSDLVGFVRPSGRLTVIELKLPGGRLSDDQRRFLQLVNIGGGYGRVCTTLAECDAAVDAAIAGQRGINDWKGKR